MNDFTNPLDSVQIASPCSSDWNQMYGDQRKRFCSECSLNVYNLSDMTRNEAESFILMSEGRVCVKMFRRDDGSIITQNCPVGLKAASERLRRFVSAFGSIVIGFIGGVVGFQAFQISDQPSVSQPVSQPWPKEGKISFSGMLSNLDEMKDKIRKTQQNEKT